MRKQFANEKELKESWLLWTLLVAGLFGLSLYMLPLVPVWTFCLYDFAYSTDFAKASQVLCWINLVLGVVIGVVTALVGLIGLCMGSILPGIGMLFLLALVGGGESCPHLFFPRSQSAAHPAQF